MNQAEKKESKKKISKTAPPQEKKDESKTIQPTETLKTDQMVQLQKELDELKKWKEDNLRQLASQLNRLKEIEERKKKEISEIEKYGKQSLVTKIIDFLVNLESRVIKAMRDFPDPQGIVLSHVEGMEATLANLKKDFEKEGVREIEVKVGVDLLNGKFHECVEQVVNPKLSAKTIIEVVKKGYLFHERVIRPAEVKISKNK